MTKKLIMMVVTAALGVATVAFADPVVTDITAKQRYPWNGLVDIGCKVSGIEGTANGYTFVVVAVNKDTGKEYAATHCTVEKGGTGVSGWEVSENGDYELLWDARTDMGQVVVERMTVRVTLEAAGVAAGMVQLWEGGPYWADRNIGADAPWDYGLYFWWGDTTGHRPSGGTFNFDFDDDNPAIYTWGKSVSELQSDGWVTSGGVLAPAHDAAHVKWGGSWRMPTDAEFSALINNCTSTWTNRNGVYGRLVTGKGAYADRSIFLPAAGFGYDSCLYAGSYGYCWSSTPNSGSSGGAWGLDFDSVAFERYNDGRQCGQSVRPVRGFAE